MAREALIARSTPRTICAVSGINLRIRTMDKNRNILKKAKLPSPMPCTKTHRRLAAMMNKSARFPQEFA